MSTQKKVSTIEIIDYMSLSCKNNQYYIIKTLQEFRILDLDSLEKKIIKYLKELLSQGDDEQFLEVCLKLADATKLPIINDCYNIVRQLYQEKDFVLYCKVISNIDIPSKSKERYDLCRKIISRIPKLMEIENRTQEQRADEMSTQNRKRYAFHRGAIRIRSAI